MALYNLGQLRQITAQNCGIQNSLGVYDFDDTTFPTLTLANQYINDAIRETTSPYDYTFKLNVNAYPFYHVLSGVQSVNLYCSNAPTNTLSGTTVITPYPEQVLNYTWTANNSVQDVNTNFSGISVSINGVGMTSYSGTQTVANWTGVGFQYQLNPDVDKIIDISIQQSINGNGTQGVIQGYSTWHDMLAMIPIGIISTSGTPIAYLENPGMDYNNNKIIQFFPSPTITTYSGEAFVCAYLKKHVDLVVDTQTQQLIPENFQNIITFAAAQKVFDINTDGRAQIMQARKEELISAMQAWDFNQPNKINMWKDYHYRNANSGGTGRSAYDISTNIFLP